MNSVIVDNEELQNDLLSLINENKNLILLARGSRDGFTEKDIGSKIDHKGATFVIVKSDSGKIFGGYTPIPW